MKQYKQRKRGEIYALMGKNGAGKSTLMKIITGVYTRDAGTVLVAGKEVCYKEPQEAEKAGSFFKAQGKGNVLLFETIKLPIPVLTFEAVVGIFYFILNHTTCGRKIYATGSNAKCAQLVGVNTQNIKMSVSPAGPR